MKTIMLTKGFEAIVDDADYEALNAVKWTAMVRNARFSQKVYAGRRNGVFMHRVIAGAEPGFVVDHINGNGLDNRRANLRVCTQAENSRNGATRGNNISGLKGVSRASATTFFARITISGERIYLGCFPTPREAADAYDRAAKALHGDYAFDNRSFRDNAYQRRGE